MKWLLIILTLALTGCVTYDHAQIENIPVTFLMETSKSRLFGGEYVTIPVYVYVDEKGFPYDESMYLGPKAILHLIKH